MGIYKLKVSEISKDNELNQYNKSRTQGYCFDYNEILEFVDKKTKTVNGDKIQEYFFNQTEKYDVFLSHSSQDIQEVTKLQKYLECEKRFKVFVDSMVWGNYKEIFERIKQEFNAQNDEYMFAHLHIILLHSLANTIRNTKRFIFIQNQNDSTKTYSPWIFHELYVANECRHKIISTEDMDNLPESFNMPIERNISFIGGFESINIETIKNWNKK